MSITIRSLRDSIALGLLLALPAVVTAAAEDEADEFDGGLLYANHCANCHGIFGEGDGIVTPSLAVVLQDLRYLSARNNGEYPRQFVIDIVDGRAVRAAHGPEGMPVWGAELARDEPLGPAFEERVNRKIDALVDFIEAIQITPQTRPE